MNFEQRTQEKENAIAKIVGKKTNICIVIIFIQS